MTNPFSHDERLTRASRTSSEGALTRGNAAQTQCHLHLRHCLTTPKQLLFLFSTPFSHTPQSGHHGIPVQSPLRSLRHADYSSGWRTSGATAAAFDTPPHPVSTRSHVLCARGKPRIPLVGVALGAGTRRAAVPPPSRRWRRGRGCAAAATRRFRRARAHTRDSSVREAGRGAPDRGLPPLRPARRPLCARRHWQVALWGKNQDKPRIAVPGTVALGMERNPDKTKID